MSGMRLVLNDWNKQNASEVVNVGRMMKQQYFCMKQVVPMSPLARLSETEMTAQIIIVPVPPKFGIPTAK